MQNTDAAKKEAVAAGILHTSRHQKEDRVELHFSDGNVIDFHKAAWDDPATAADNYEAEALAVWVRGCWPCPACGAPGRLPVCSACGWKEADGDRPCPQPDVLEHLRGRALERVQTSTERDGPGLFDERPTR